MMKRRFQPLMAFLILTLVTIACGLPSAGGSPGPSQGEVSTAVALTFQALTPGGGVAMTPAPIENSLLPHSLYFLANDSAGVTQVFRLEKDGTTRKQVTSETGNVGNYAVSPVDGSVAYVVNNQIMLINVDGSNRRMLVDGGMVDENNAFVNGISNLEFSPDGQTLAYGHHGLNFYSLASGASTRAIEDKLKDMGNGMILPAELYRPEKYSPDGSRLMVTLAYYEGADTAFYDLQSKALTRLEDTPGALICCDMALWSADGSWVYSANSAAGMFNPGLWQVNPVNGDVTTLLASNYDTSEFNLAKYPYLAPDNQLYFFFLASSTGEYSRTPMQLVRSAPDGVTGRTVVREEKFDMMNEALWAPNASFVIVVKASSQDVYQGGIPSIVYLDGKPDVQLADSARQLIWGP
jgi:hypothetical protein